jgi:type II secretory pathway component PulF
VARRYVRRKQPTLIVEIEPEQAVAAGTMSRENVMDYVWRASPGRLHFFFERFAQMLAAGMTVHETLRTLSGSSLGRRLSRAAASMVAPIAAGSALSEQLDRYPELFPSHVRGLVRAGEKSGRLDRICAQIAEEYRARQQRSWGQALVQLWFSIPLVLVLLVAPLPRIIDLGVSWYLGFLLRVSLPAFLGAIFLYYLGKIVFNLRAVRPLRDRVLYGLPVAGAMIRQAAIRRYLLALEALIAAGVEIQEAMQIGAGAAGNAVIEMQLQQVAAKVRRGVPIGAALAGAKAVPTEVRQSLETAERAGSYDQAFVGLQDWGATASGCHNARGRHGRLRGGAACGRRHSRGRSRLRFPELLPGDHGPRRGVHALTASAVACIIAAVCSMARGDSIS